ncbi:methyl-accepting chemotaxis protein [Actinoplanes sp. CA-030573]|uniref:methyl-accepting chemotaxis protein n=1 Tax=Actinoplanes sp. CA-030573 TaxID=3239898 RepID=UPI003D92D933
MAFRMLTDRRVGTKIMVAVGIVAAFSTVDGLYALDSLSTTNDQVKAGYVHEQELAAIGNLRAAANKVWLGADDYQLADTAAEQATATSAIAANQSQVERSVATYRSYPLAPGEAAAITGFETHWAAYRDLLENRLMPMAEAGNRSGLAGLRAGEVAAAVDTLHADLVSLGDLTVQAGAAQETDAEDRYQRTKWLVGALLGVALVAGLALAAGIARLIVTSLNRCAGALGRIAEGDLTARVEVGSRDEVGRMAAALNRTAEAMAGMVGRINASSSLLADASDELSAVSAQLSASAEETSVQVGAVAESAGQVSDGVRAVSAGADEMGVSIREISDNANEAAVVAADAARAAAATDAGVARLGEASNQIGAVVQMITSIAEQTNLLALNATIEAARAGEAGKGFAVVASEVKDLAMETARATQEITAQVGAIQAESDSAVGAIQEIGRIITTISDYTTTIAAAVEEQTATTGEISRSVERAADGSSAIAETIAGVAEAAKHVTDSATETQQTASELARTAAELQATVAAYRV